MNLLYVLDKGNKFCAEVDVYKPDAGLEKPDVVVVTAIYYYDIIKDELRSLGYSNIVSLQDLVLENNIRVC